MSKTKKADPSQEDQNQDDEIPASGVVSPDDSLPSDEEESAAADKPEFLQLKKTIEAKVKNWSQEDRAVVLGALKQQEVQDLISEAELEELASALGYSQAMMSHLPSLTFIQEN